MTLTAQIRDNDNKNFIKMRVRYNISLTLILLLEQVLDFFSDNSLVFIIFFISERREGDNMYNTLGCRMATSNIKKTMAIWPYSNPT